MTKHLCKLALAAVFATSLGLHAQGFGIFSKKTVTINRLLPPTVNLKGKKIRIEAAADSVQKDGDQLRNLLKTRLVTLVQKDPRFILNENSPETILKFSITNYYTEIWTVGTGQNQSKAYRGKIEVAFQAIDAATGTALDSENLVETAGYDPVGSSPTADFWKTNNKKIAAENSENETRDQLVTNIVAAMAKRVAPSDEPFDAPLPGKKLEPLSSLALSGRWGDLQEQAEKLDKLPKPEDDAYRQYLIALAEEAQAYDLTREANDRSLGKRADISAADAQAEFLRAQKDLDESGKIYKEIITENSREKEFRPGDTRTEEALAIYAKISRYNEESAKAQAAAKTALQASAGGGGSGASPSAGKSTPLEQVLDFCTRGIEVSSIKEYIASDDFLDDAKSTGYKFNFAKDPLRLHDACKANAGVIQSAMRDRLKPLSASRSAGSPGAKTAAKN